MSEEEKKEIEIVTGDGKDLDISPVYDHIKIDSITNREKKKNVVIPKTSKDKENNKKNSN